jgi:hypothetical protein
VSKFADSGNNVKMESKMSKPRPAAPVKLILSAIYSDRAAWLELLPVLEKKFGAIDHSTKEMGFEFTKYYEDEMGAQLSRQLLSFSRLVDPSELAEIKLFTNSLELQKTDGDRRKVNLDPGYISIDLLVLATGKHSPHRVYLKDGIWADLHLIYRAGSFQALEWTYPDYRSEALISLFNQLREALKVRLKTREQEKC